MLVRTSYLLVLLFPFTVFSQVNSVNHSLIDSSLNIAYLGVDNSIEIIGYKGSNKLSYSTTNGTITSLGQNQYVLRPAKEGECIISFQSKGQKIASKIFRIDTLTNLIARLAGVRDSFATVQQIITNSFLIIEVPKSFYKARCIVRSFLLTMDGAGFEDTDPYEIVGNIIPEFVIKRIKNLKKGDQMWFEQIIMNCADCRARKLPPFKIIIR